MRHLVRGFVEQIEDEHIIVGEQKINELLEKSERMIDLENRHESVLNALEVEIGRTNYNIPTDNSRILFTIGKRHLSVDYCIIFVRFP